jgi:hypothetical protein
MKKISMTVAMALALALGFALAGCGGSQKGGMVKGTPDLEWTKVESAQEAATGAGIEAFGVPEKGTKLLIGELGPWEYRYAKELAEADGSAGAVSIVIRKGIGNGDNTGELSDFTANWGELKDMNYPKQWNIEADGTNVRCYGVVEGKALKVAWADGTNNYSILALGQGDKWQEPGLGADDIAVLVKGMKKVEEPAGAEQAQQPESQQQEQQPQQEAPDAAAAAGAAAAGAAAAGAAAAADESATGSDDGAVVYADDDSEGIADDAAYDDAEGAADDDSASVDGDEEAGYADDGAAQDDYAADDDVVYADDDADAADYADDVYYPEDSEG